MALCVTYILVNLATEPGKTGCNWRPKLKSRWLYKYLRVFKIATLTLNLLAVWIKNKQKSFAYSSRCKTHAGGTTGDLWLSSHSAVLISARLPIRIFITIVRFACFHGCILEEQRDFIRSFFSLLIIGFSCALRLFDTRISMTIYIESSVT